MTLPPSWPTDRTSSLTRDMMAKYLGKTEVRILMILPGDTFNNQVFSRMQKKDRRSPQARRRSSPADGPPPSHSAPRPEHSNFKIETRAPMVVMNFLVFTSGHALCKQP